MRDALRTRLAAGALLLLAAACGSGSASPTIPSVQRYEVTSRDHVRGNVDYPQQPPVGGAHNPVWQNCGFYSEPIPEETAVHSMEHGAVWVTYEPDLPEDQIVVLRQLGGQPYILVSPYPGQPAPVIASAWGLQVEVSSATDPALSDFVREYVRGAQAPEPRGACDGGVGEPG